MAKFYYGGQAVMEGVMMRGRASAAVSVRRPGRSIYLYEQALKPRLHQNRLFRLPFLRGILLLLEKLGLGTRMMTLSANIATGAIDPGEAAVQPEGSSMPGIHTPGSAAGALPEEPAPPPRIGGAGLCIA